MCMEDVRINRSKRGRLITLAVGFESTYTIDRNERRVALIFNPSPGSTYYLEQTDVDGNTSRFQINSDGQPIIMSIDNYGDMITQSWVVSGDGASVDLRYMEIWLERT